MCSCLLFECSLAHRDLHSFPTRRSSDLGQSALVESQLALFGRAAHARAVRGGYLHETIRDSAYLRRRLQPAWRAFRSEEHTSELQSHSDLVCRLLLEKKK